jgi:Rhs element Vgr protein
MSISVKNIVVTIGGIASNGFDITIEGIKWRLDNFSLIQSLLSYNTLSFDMHKGPEEGLEETRHLLCSQLIGKEITLALNTENIENLSLNSSDEKTAEINFKGLIFSASGSRRETEYSVVIEARSWEALLNDNPNCKSFEEMTLNDIVSDVVDDYGQEINANVDARFTESIPYCVQYNETNYQFLQRLARRYGEWLYNDGEQMVFGNLVSQDSVSLNYPSKDIPSYHVDLQMLPVAFHHVASSYNAYDATKKDGLGEMQLEYNELNESAFNASQKCFTKETLQNLHSGGYADEDGRETILNVSTKTQARGEKANMLTYSGETYCSKLKIGSTLVIVDNYITDLFSNAKSDVEQDEILITELVHYFSADEQYSNHFYGIPSACDYPPYANSDVYPVAPSCRAKVTDNEDPMDWGRIRVQFDWQAQLDDSMMTPWLRIAQPYAGGGKGFSFIPEIGEEVMVDFEGGNAERPYVKGTLYNGIGDPDPDWLPSNNSNNPIKAIRTRNGHTIEIHDEGDDGYIRIYDNEKENYVLTFSTDEKLIKLESTGNIELYAKNDIIMRAGHDMNIKVDHDYILESKHDIITDARNEHTSHSDERMNLDTGSEMFIHSDEDMYQSTFADYHLQVDGNTKEELKKNLTIDVGDNTDMSVTNNLEVASKNMNLQAQDKMNQYSVTHQMNATNSMSISATSSIDIKALVIKEN